MKILFITVSLNTKYLKYCTDKVSQYFPNSKHIIVDGSSNWPYPAFEWTKLINQYDSDYTILVDEDCYITSEKDIYDVIEYMKENSISICGPSEGYSKYRSANPYAMNTFFMVINTKDYKSLNLDLSNIKFGLNENGWHNNLFNNYSESIWVSPKPELDKSIGGSNLVYEQEPYYFIFWEMIKAGMKFHYLYQNFDEELKSINLRLNKDSNDICIHMWYLRQHDQSFDVWGLPNNKRYELLEKRLLNRKDKIGLLIIATNKYTSFLNNLIESADKYFLKDNEVEYFIFTNQSLEITSNRKINYINVDHKEWPWMTLGRYKIFTNNSNKFNECTYLFYTDVDMLFVGDIGKEILSDRVATIHPGYLGGRGTPETNHFSLACVKNYENMQYYAGGFNGGSKSEYLKMASTISTNIDIDYANDIIAIWHDESHLNRYFIDNDPTKVLDPGYCYPEKANLPYTKRLLALDKNHTEIREESKNVYDLVSSKKDLCFDVGANIGNRTDKFLSLGFKKVIAVEPQLDCLSILRKKYLNNDKVVIVDEALSNEVGISQIHISDANTISSMSSEFITEVKKERFKTYNWSDVLEISTTTMDNLINLYGVPDFCKIDVEGYELNVLAGLSKPIQFISFEYTPELHYKSMMCIDKLNSISNKYVYNFSLGETLEFSLKEWVDKSFMDKWLKENLSGRDQNGLLFGDLYAKLVIS